MLCDLRRCRAISQSFSKHLVEINIWFDLILVKVNRQSRNDSFIQSLGRRNNSQNAEEGIIGVDQDCGFKCLAQIVISDSVINLQINSRPAFIDSSSPKKRYR